MASLTIVVDGAEQKVPLESATVTLGRGLESDVRLKDIKASRRHCQVVKSPKGYQCVDLSSGNGTYVNGIQIKSQMLSPGDRITIGSTTIVFEETPKLAAFPKAATAKIPVPPAPAPRQSSKVATAKVQVAPTRRTDRVEGSRSASQAALKPVSQAALKPVSQGALKPVSQGALKLVSQGGLKPATHPLSKSGSRVGKSTGRGTGTRPPRPAAEPPARKSPVARIVGVAVLLCALGAGGWWFFLRDNGDQVRDQVDQLLKKGHAAEAQEHFDAAVGEYKKALELCQGDRYKIRASEISKLIAQIESRRTEATAAPPKPGPREVPEKTADVPAKKTEIEDKHKLGGNPASADWAGALKDWAEFASRKNGADSSVRIQEEVRTLQARAKEDVDRLKKKAEALVKENKMAEAVEFLKRQTARFEGADALADLDAAIKQYDR